MASGRRIARHTGWLLAAQLLTTAMLLAQAVMVTRALGPALFGVMVLIMTWSNTVRQLLDSRLWEPILKFVPQYRAAGRSDRAGGVLAFCLLIEIGTAVLVLAVVGLTAELAAAWLTDDPTYAWLFRLYAWSAALAIPTNLTSALLRLADRPGWLSAHKVIISTVHLSGTIWIVMTGPTVAGLIVVQLAGLGVGAIAGVVLMGAASRALGLSIWPRGGLTALRGEYRTVIRFCLMTNLTGCSRVVQSHADVLLLAWLGAPAIVGVYDLARRIAGQMADLFGPLQMSILPEVSIAAAAGRHDDLRRLSRQLTKSMLAVALVLCLATTLLAPWITPLIFGAAFEPSVVLIQIMVWQLLWLPAVWIPSYLLVTGRAGTLAALAWISTIVFLVLLVTLIPAIGVVGAAWSTTLYNLTFLWLATWAFRKITEERSAFSPPAEPLTVGDR